MINSGPRRTIACFVSPHGYGHAARACAIMEALGRLDAGIRFEVFSLVPEWFFDDSLSLPFGYHRENTDIGMVQRNSLVEDPAETVRQLDAFLPFRSEFVDRLAGQVARLNCRMILCDISPLGIAVAQKAGIPSVLIENFTWDWIYEGHAAREPGFKKHIAYLREIFLSADHHIQAEPVCLRDESLFSTDPISRAVRIQAQEVRKNLGLRDRSRAVMITMGGIPWDFTFLESLKRLRDITFVIPGAARERQHSENLILLPHHSGFFHPDLINACDAAIGKVGYSTVAEVYQGGLPFGYVTREAFPESDVLVSYVRNRMQGIEVTGGDFQNGSWTSCLPELLGFSKIGRAGAGGARQAAGFIHRLL